MLVAREPGRVDRRRAERVLDRDGLLWMPGASLVERAQDAGDEALERIELLDRRIRAVDEQRAGLEQRAVGVRPRLVRPEALGEVAVRGRMAELHRGGDAERGEARHVLL